VPDLVEQLQRYAEAATATVPPVELDAVRRTSRRHWQRPALVAAAILLVVGLLAAVATVDRPDQPVRLATDPPVEESPEPSTSTTAPTPTTGPAIGSFRSSPVVAVTDTEYLVWSGEAGGGTSIRADGYAVEISTGAVRPIPVAPIEPRSGATGVWTGQELIVCCGGTPNVGARSAAAWNPQSGAWRTLAVPPESIARSYATSAWTGELLLVVAQGPAAATYDPSTDVWTEIPAPPVVGRMPESIWTGEEVIAWDSTRGSQIVPPDGSVADQGWSWRPGDQSWTPLPPLPAGSRIALGSIAWTGTDVVVWGESTAKTGTGVGARWQPGATAWRPVARFPAGPVLDPFVGTTGSQTLASGTDGRILVRGLDGSQSYSKVYVYDPAANTWTPTPLPIFGIYTVVDGHVFVPDELTPIIGDLPP
jgi:hypothetical protein